MTIPADEVVDLVSALIRFDTSNTGDLATTKGEAECARWVADRLAEVGYQPEFIESGAPGRGNVFVRLPGADRKRGGFEVQVNVVDAAVLKEAQERPAEYADLVVRIGGYTDYFTRLSPQMQAEVMQRTEFAGT